VPPAPVKLAACAPAVRQIIAAAVISACLIFIETPFLVAQTISRETGDTAAMLRPDDMKKQAFWNVAEMAGVE
jgi:hypothetical protein